MDGKQPYFSIVVVSFNAEATIKGTIDSVLGQTFGDYEIIVKDAASTDGTLEMIPSDPRIRIYSCKDGGIYDGMNQGIGKSSGRYLTFLNCGDLFHDENVLENVHNFSLRFGNDCRRVVIGDYCSGKLVCKLPQNVTRAFLSRRPLCHQAMFFGKVLFDEFGPYDSNYKVLADYDLTLRLANAGVPFAHSDTIVCDYLGDGFSERHKEMREKETRQIQRIRYSGWERFKSGAFKVLTLQKLRNIVASNRSPAWIRKAYNKIANVFNS